MNIIQKIEQLIETDDCNQDEQSGYIRGIYESASDFERRAINRIFIALCGYSLETILAGVKP